MNRLSKRERIEEEWTRWQAVLNNDKDVFERLAEPCLQDLLKAARHDINYYRFMGRLQSTDLSPEEVVGETLIRAWEERYRRPREVSLRGWLLGMQYRVMQGLVHSQERYRRSKAISLDEPLPAQPVRGGVEESFWEWHQPDDYNTWEEVIPSEVPVTFDITELAARGAEHLPPEAQHVLILHDHFSLPLDEVAYIMNQTIRDTEGTLQEARTGVEQRLRDRGM